MVSYCMRPRNHTTPTQDHARWSGGLQCHGQQAAMSEHHAGFNAATASWYSTNFNAAAATRAFDVPTSAQLSHGLNSNPISIVGKRVRKEKLKKIGNWSDQ